MKPPKSFYGFFLSETEYVFLAGSINMKDDSFSKIIKINKYLEKLGIFSTSAH
jgi:hypothetical protein